VGTQGNILQHNLLLEKVIKETIKRNININATGSVAGKQDINYNQIKGTASDRIKRQQQTLDLPVWQYTNNVHTIKLATHNALSCDISN